MQNRARTLENMWVMGLVTLILNKPAMQSRNPKLPVTSDPHRKMRAEESSWVLLEIFFQISNSSPSKTTKGKSMTAEPAFVHQAS